MSPDGGMALFVVAITGAAADDSISPSPFSPTILAGWMTVRNDDPPAEEGTDGTRGQTSPPPSFDEGALPSSSAMKAL